MSGNNFKEDSAAKKNARSILDDIQETQEKAPSLPQNNQNYDLFATLLGPSGDTEQLSNLLSFWDSIPRYSVSRQIQASMRNEAGNLPILRKEFQTPAGEICEMELKPARIEVGGEEKDFYPAESEELIEDILRKIFLQQRHGFHDSDRDESWCKFTINMIVKELKAFGKVRSHEEVKQALEIMENCRLTITVNGKQAYSSNILSDKLLQDRASYRTNSNALSAVKFSSLISRAINKFDYRQYNYADAMSLKQPLARWLFKRLADRFINAGIDAPAYKIIFTEIDRDSGLMHHRLVTRRIETLKMAVEELVESGVLMRYEMNSIKDGKKIVDAVFMLHASMKFIKEMKAANARQKIVKEKSLRLTKK
ncbi:MAG TPA: hypothetical protein ENI26_08245 [Methylophaga aminisulfidivorans]|uniref:Replication protein n=2 Tax=root TaxID=1 RepID=A0A7C1ZRM9_9GAMM|nr:hypothetical protein [Methylophaga sp.]HEC74347.1 hypothetical protein [Methylophaga aminisulfidivorans]